MIFDSAAINLKRTLRGENKRKDDCLDSRCPKMPSGTQCSQFLRRLDKWWTMRFKGE